MTSGFGKIDYKNDAMMQTILQWPEKEGIVTVKKVGKDENPPAILSGIYSVPRAEKMDSNVEKVETSWVARTIQHVVGNEKIYDIKEGKERPVEYRDIALIQRTNTPTSKFTAEFQKRGIPYETVGAKEGLKTQDIDLFNSLIKVLSNPRQDYPLLVVMQSFFGQFTIDDIIDLRKNREEGEWLYDSLLLASSEGNEKAKDLLELINRYRRQAYLVSVPDLMLSIATETGYDAEMLSSLDERISSFNAYVSYLRDKDFAKNIDSYLVWVSSDSEIEVKLPSAGVNAVSIGTIHGAKGLEYPIVFLTSTHINPRQGSGAKGSPVIVADKDLGIGFKVLKQNKALVNSLSYLAIERKKLFLDKEEGLRVLYVALTRAQNRLFVTATKEDEGPKAISKYPWEINTYIDLIDYASQYSDVVRKAYNNFDPPEDDKIVSFHQAPEINYEKDDLKLTFPEYEHVGATMIGNKYTVTELSAASYTERESGEGKIEFIPGLAPISVEEGIRYHTILQYIDFTKDSKEEVSKQIDEMVSSGLLGSYVNRKKINDDIILKALQNPLFKQIANMHILREQEFQLYLPHREISLESDVEDKVIVQGIIDLVAYNDKGEAILVDYKYSSASCQEIYTRYSKQIDIYALAIERVLKKKLVKKVVYLIGKDEIVEF
jgi:ATP-dependent helicase/nuclease subunit A